METTKFIWQNGAFVAWEDAKTHVLTHTLHYGAGAFEGIRCYETPQGPAIFRLEEHIDRLVYSSEAINMDLPWDRETMIEATKELIRKNEISACYIRPLTFYGYGKMGLNPVGAPVEMIIACWPWGKYLGGDTVRVQVSSFIRIHPRSLVADAKIVGHYVNSIMASLEVHRDPNFDESLLLDYNGNIAEGPGENIFMIKDGIIYTPPLGNVLNGITRNSIFTIAQDLGIEVIEKTLTLEEVQAADEAFYTGTAAEVAGIVQIDSSIIGTGSLGEITKTIKDTYMNAVTGKDGRYTGWLTYVS